jgi:prophage regulatory protein
MNQMINIKKVQFTSINRSKIYEMMDEKSKYYDPTFPKKVRIRKSVLAGQLRKSINGLKISWKIENKGSFAPLFFGFQ